MTDEQKKEAPKPKPEPIDYAPYEKMVNDLLASHGLNPDQCRQKPKTLWSAYRGSALIYTEIFKLNDIDYMEISSPIMTLPSKNILPFYRKLLEINWQLMGIKFFMRGEWVYISENRELRGLDFDELKQMEDRVSYYADYYDDLLVKEFKIQ